MLWIMFHERMLDIERREAMMRNDNSEEPRRVVSDTELFKLMKINPRGNA